MPNISMSLHGVCTRTSLGYMITTPKEVEWKTRSNFFLQWEKEELEDTKGHIKAIQTNNITKISGYRQKYYQS